MGASRVCRRAKGTGVGEGLRLGAWETGRKVVWDLPWASCGDNLVFGDRVFVERNQKEQRGRGGQAACATD